MRHRDRQALQQHDQVQSMNVDVSEGCVQVDMGSDINADLLQQLASLGFPERTD